jgi:translation initiation factor 1
MPFTIDGQWVPSKAATSAKKPVKVRLGKRGQSIITSILNLNMTAQEKEILASTIKKKLGCGGAVKDEALEIQGDKVSQVKQLLQSMGIKSS